jgi:glycerol-3-phosphate dehydrogenase
LHPDGPDIVAQVVYAHDFEWARRPEDVIKRRTTVALRGLADAEIVARVDAVMRGDLPAPTRA